MALKRGRRTWGLAVAGMLVALATALWAARSVRRPSPADLGREAYDRGDWAMAADEARSRLKSGPDDTDALRLLARASARRGRETTAEGIYRRLGTSAMEPEDLFLLGRSLLRQGNATPGLAALGAARDADPRHAETLDELGRYWGEHGSQVEAERAATQLAALPGWEVRGSVRLAGLLAETFDPAGAASVLGKALQRDPALSHASSTPAEAHRLLVRTLLEAGRPAEARSHLYPSPSDAEGSWLLSRLLLQEGKTAEAESALQSTRGLLPDDPVRHEPGPFVGSKACADCHATQHQGHERSGHSRTLVRTSELPSLPWPSHEIIDGSNPEVRHAFRLDKEKVESITTTPGETYRALVTYALGSNHQGQTFLSEDAKGQCRELRLSRYPNDPTWDRTMEHPEAPPDREGYSGRPISAEALRRCLHCHATNFRAVQSPSGHPEANDSGIGCERCHGPGGNHLQSVATKFSDLAIARPKLAPAARVVELCAECHKAPGSAKANEPGFIRYQAPTFIQSRCYSEGRTGFSCVTCHDPHRPTSRDPKSYEATCLSCHAAGKDQAQAKNQASPCPVNAKHDCLRCHMPRVNNAVPRAIFTDHHIRIRETRR
ncbi:tetratricopeptide repeat protein [Singulisphaera sp. PoT]|uniref:tetratricopeptide repeat protein n=1 Tax=Singulisphaera sp. PoT TaxID=3411797 RepID=UPI003BF613A7